MTTRNILVLNCGSSSLKYQLFATNGENFTVIAKGTAEKVGAQDSFLKHNQDGNKQTINEFFPDHTSVLNKIIQLLGEQKIDAVGHRVVHGGEDFTSSVLATPEVIDVIKANTPLAPLHNPANLIGIEASQKAFPNAEQIAVFDTAFHQTMPAESYLYSVPLNWYKEHKIRRYGFHGTSHLYVSKRAAKMLNTTADKINIITLHLGSGASACAIRQGNSVDTSMGMTPMEGLVMSKRAGDIDPGMVFYLTKQLGMSLDEINSDLNHKSGLFGLSGSGDLRDVLNECELGNKSACDSITAFNIMVNRIKKYIGSYMAELGRTDAIVFTGGIGERSFITREAVIKGLEELGVKIDKEVNDKIGEGAVEESVISTADSRIKVLVIPTDEERVIAEDSYAILNGTYNANHLKMNYAFIKE